MPVAKLKTTGTADVMKSEEGNDSLDTFIRQAIGKEPFLSFSRAGDSPVQWIQLLHALDQQDLPGWPLLSPLKLQMQKCEKCSREFCSTINYRRHIRLHRRSLNLDKDSAAKNKDFLQAFWDKLSVDEAMKVVSFKDGVTLEDVTGSSIIIALTSFIRKPGFSSLPHAYVRAGSALLDIVEARPSRFPVMAKDLFGILDDASEKTFLCAGTAESVQKYIFDGETGKIGLEMRNLVAYTSFLIELKLVKAWLTDKDAEALRCQKLLVEEEEAAQKRQAALLERKRQKKLRQKEQKMKEQANEEQADSQDDVVSTTDSAPSPPTPSPPNASNSDSLIQHVLMHDQLPLNHEPSEVNMDEDENNGPQSDLENGYPDSGACQNVEHQMLRRNGRRHLVNSHWQNPKLQRGPNGFFAGQNHQGFKHGTTQKHGSYRESRSGAAIVGKVWTPKPKSEIDEETCKLRSQNEMINLSDKNKNSEVLIGSISVVIGNQVNQQQDGNNGGGAPSSCSTKHSIHEKATKLDVLQGAVNKSTVKLWRPVGRHENAGSLPVPSGVEDSKTNSPFGIGSDDPLLACPANGNDSNCKNNISSMEGRHPVGGLRFSSHAAEAFLAQRWKQAMASDHVKLVLFPDAEPGGSPEIQDDLEKVAASSELNHAENDPAGSFPKYKSKTRSEKGSKVRYLPKQRCPN
ncbi:hypothetical protein Ancab_009211 [Ancistrocladus abbreviatus]